MSNIIHKVKDSITGDKHGHDAASDNTAPQSSNMVNKTDPLAGSDISHRSNPTSNLTPADAGYGTSTTVSQDAGYGASSTNVSHGTDYATTSSATPGSGAAHGTAGPHDSNIANRLDPRVDSDLDGSNTYGGHQTTR